MCYNYIMVFDDDDELANIRPESPQDEFTHADRGRRKALEKKVEREFGKKIRGDEAKLHAQVDRKKLLNEVSGKKDDEDKRKERAEKEAEEEKTFGTKTLMQEEKEATITAHEKTTPDKIIEKTKEKKEEQDQAGQEYQQQMG